MKIEIDKPVVPQFVADWVEEHKEQPIYKLLDSDLIYDIHDELARWLLFGNEKTKKERELNLVLAHIYGYELEKEKKYYAKIKGWELTEDECAFWNYRVLITNITPSRLYTGDKEQEDFFDITKMTIEEWNKVGINDTNADFEEVG